jgi:hypothetical protein
MLRRRRLPRPPKPPVNLKPRLRDMRRIPAGGAAFAPRGAKAAQGSGGVIRPKKTARRGIFGPGTSVA